MLASDLLKVEQLVPNAVLAKAVSTYVVADDFMGSAEFYPFATPNGGSMALTVNRYTKGNGASGRLIGKDYAEDTGAVNEPVTFHLKPIGAKITVDKAVARGLTDSGKAIYVTNQVRQKSNQTKNEVARQFIDGSGEGIEIKGLRVLTDEEERVSTDKVDITGGATREKAEAFLEFFNKQFAKGETVEFNRIYCDAEFAATLATFKQLLNSATTPITIGEVQLKQFLDVPIVKIPGVDFNVEDEVTGDVYKTFYLARMDEDAGIALGLPQDSIVLDMQDPFDAGSVIKEGYVECITSVVVIDPNAILRCEGVKVKAGFNTQSFEPEE